MHFPALALGWELWARHRVGLSIVTAAYILAGALVWLLPQEGARLVAGVSRTAILFIYLYLLSVFLCSENSPDGHSAGLPRRLFTLPMRTSLLVAWPMLYGAVAVTLLWYAHVAVALAVRGGAGVAEASHWFPPLAMATFLVTLQAICWTLVRSPLLRLTTALLILPSIFLSIILYLATHNIDLSAREVGMALVLTMLAAYALAVFGVARDRRGECWSWDWLMLLIRQRRWAWPGRSRPFRSALAAQTWLEIRSNAWLLPLCIGLFLTMLLWWARALTLDRVDVARILVALVVTPVCLAFFAGFAMGKKSIGARDLNLSPLAATQPVSSKDLADAKLRAAAWSAAVTWLLIVVLAVPWAILSGNLDVVRRLVQPVFSAVPAWEAAVIAPLMLFGLVGLTWLQFVAGMCLSLTGRTWVVNSVVLAYVAVAGILVALSMWTTSHPGFFERLLLVLWWLAAGLGLVQLAALGWISRRPAVLSERVLPRAVGLWLAIAGSLLVPLFALAPASSVSTTLIALWLLLAMPLTRLVALPAAVAWNRHR